MSAVIPWLFGAVGKYLLIAVVGVSALAWIRADAAAPYKAEIAELEASLAQRVEIEQGDKARAKADRAEIRRLMAQVEAIVNESGDSCNFDSSQRELLHRLAVGKN